MKKTIGDSENGIISARHLSFSYGKHRIFDDVGFTIYEKDYVTILGPNGGGKSTLAKLIVGLLEPESGTIRIRGNLPRNAGHLIGYVPQYINFDVNFPITVTDTVLMGCLNRYRGFYTKEQRSDAAAALESVGLEDMRHAAFSEISGGQRQRVLIARALVAKPDLLILDEPTAGIDAAVEKDLSGLLSRFHETMTIIMVTHDLGFVEKSVSRVLCVNNGVAEHPVEDINESLILSAYGHDVKSVRHDIHMEKRK